MTVEASARGKASRSRGHRCERDVAAWLRLHGYPEAHTTRSALGSDGTRTPGDVVGPVGVVVEVKDVQASAWPTWCRQAAAEAHGRLWVVVRRTRGVGDVGLWDCRWGHGGMGDEDGRGMFGAFIANLSDPCPRCLITLVPGEPCLSPSCEGEERNG